MELKSPSLPCRAGGTGLNGTEMYYHSRKLKHVVYGKVGPAPEEQVDPFFEHAYRWLGCYCGFFPQVWLSRGSSGMTGFRQAYENWSLRTGRSFRRRRPSQILFGFDVIKGFPVDFDLWHMILGILGNAVPFRSREESDRLVAAGLDEFFRWCRDEDCAEDTPTFRDWKGARGLEEYLGKHLFVETDQVVVPSLNLKSAKRIVCRNEGQKKSLRRMGFIEDRIEVRNLK